jgi:N-acetyl-alpha-D-muramate 1-phosphate uridylyltransferase
MKVMILAAGKGRRMLPLSRTIPKPLLKVNGKPLIERHIERLIEAGFSQILINLYHLGEQIELNVGDGSRWGVEIVYSREPKPLETGGGIANALDLLGEGAFAVVNGDIWTDYDFNQLPGDLDSGLMGHLVMVDNPEHHREGDFAITDTGRLAHSGTNLTYSGISVLSSELFAGCIAEPFPLRKQLDPAIHDEKISGEHFKGRWSDVGTIDRYELLQKEFD